MVFVPVPNNYLITAKLIFYLAKKWRGQGPSGLLYNEMKINIEQQVTIIENNK